MNILIPHNWLLDHLDTLVKPEEIARCLSLCGPSVERIHQIEGDSVYDIEVTTNRVDMMSVRGIAREAAAILPEFGHKAILKSQDFTLTHTLITSNKLPQLELKISNQIQLSRRIMAIKMAGVEIKSSPKKMQTRLMQVGQRPLNNIIDITNYVMWDLGHPIHAFDYDRLTEKTIIVREGIKGETLSTLDGKTHTLKGGEVVFDDGTGTIVDLPGIMGTANTVITDKTTNVLFWIESIDARKIRQASMNLQVRTQAAILNEKHVDPELAPSAINQAVSLLTKTSSSTIASRLVDIYPQPARPTQTVLTQQQLDSYLGIHIPAERVQRILIHLECQVEMKKSNYILTPPTFRSHDLLLPVDYIEEIARMYGYHNLESRIMDTAIPDNPTTDNFTLEYLLKQWLAGWGTTEVYTYSMVSQEIAEKSGDLLEQHVQIKNPYSSDWVYLRRSLIPSLAEVLDKNQKHTTTIFEMQNTYHKNEKEYGLPVEKRTLAILTNKSFNHLKGIIDALMEKFHVTGYSVLPAKGDNPFMHQKCGQINSDTTVLGQLGEVVNQQYWGAEISLEAFAKVCSNYPQYHPSFPFSPIIEDLTFSLPPTTYLGPVISTISKLHRHIHHVDLKSTYNNNATFTITYQDREQQLTDRSIDSTRILIVETLNRQFQAILVGSLQ
jgi:phenylalanyl-tRNA synthetase beta chain